MDKVWRMDLIAAASCMIEPARMNRVSGRASKCLYMGSLNTEIASKGTVKILMREDMAESTKRDPPLFLENCL